MTRRRLWVAATVAGVLAFVASWLFGRIPGLHACGPSGGLGPIIAFEFVRSPADVAMLFGTEPCRSTLVAAQYTGLLLDELWFIPAYTAFLTIAAWATGVRWRRWLAIALIVAGLSDEVEGLLLWSILGDLPGTQGRIEMLWIAVHLKFALLAIGTFGIGWALAARPRDWRRLPGAVVAAAGAYAAFGLLYGTVPRMMLGFTIGWFALLGVALCGALWPSAYAGFAGRPRDPIPPGA